MEERMAYGLKQKRKDKKAFYIGFAIIFGFILALVLFVYFAIQHEKNLRAELLKNGIETVGVIDRVYFKEGTYDEERGRWITNSEWIACYSFIEMETQNMIHKEIGIKDSLLSIVKPKSQYRIRYLKEKPKRTARIYFDEPITKNSFQGNSSEKE